MARSREQQKAIFASLGRKRRSARKVRSERKRILKLNPRIKGESRVEAFHRKIFPLRNDPVFTERELFRIENEARPMKIAKDAVVGATILGAGVAALVHGKRIVWAGKQLRNFGQVSGAQRRIVAGVLGTALRDSALFAGVQVAPHAFGQFLSAQERNENAQGSTVLDFNQEAGFLKKHRKRTANARAQRKKKFKRVFRRKR